jgi:hypothetical protein
MSKTSTTKNLTASDKIKGEVREMRKTKSALKRQVENLKRMKEAKGNLQAEIDLLTEEQTNLLASIG